METTYLFSGGVIAYGNKDTARELLSVQPISPDYSDEATYVGLLYSNNDNERPMETHGIAEASVKLCHRECHGRSAATEQEKHNWQF